jgi:ceramide glucosyltransferase
MSILAALGWGFAVLAAAGCLYTVMTAVFVLRFFSGPPARQLVSDPVTILKPLHGSEAGLDRNLTSFFAEARSQKAQIVFGVQDPADPAAAAARALAARHPDVRADLCIDDAEHGLNRKISNLINMTPHAAHAVLVLSDSDIGAPPHYLARVVSALAAPTVGVVTCPYYGRGETGVWSDLAAMGISYQFLPNLVTGVSLGMAKPCMGSTIALRRETLERIGGFEAFRDVLADDYALGAAVRGLGLKSVVTPVLVSHSCSETSVREIFAHELRWARTIRGVDYAGHMGSVVTHPLPLALMSIALLGVSAASLAGLGAALLTRLVLMTAIDRVIDRRLGPLWLWPLRDILSFIVFVASFFGRAVVWRGETFHVTTDGELRPV